MSTQPTRGLPHTDTRQRVYTQHTQTCVYKDTEYNYFHLSSHPSWRHTSLYLVHSPPALRYRGLEHSPRGQTLQETVHNATPP